MKRKQLYNLSVCVLLCLSMHISNLANAQTWNLAGNTAIPAGSFLGTTDANDVLIRTNNVNRATFNAAGGLTMTTDIKYTSAAYGITFATGSPRAPRPMIYMFSTGTTNADRMVIAHSSAYPTYGLQYQDLSDKFNFLSNGTNVMTVDLNNKRVGITTNAPSYPLHVTGDHTTTYVTSDFLNPSEAAMKCVINVPFNYGATALYCKGNTANGTATAGYFESDFIAVDAHCTAGASATAYGTSGTATGGSAAYGAWGSASGASVFNYAVYAAGNLAYTGSLIHVSDQKLKKNINPFGNALDKIMQLKPSTYEYRADEFGKMNLAGGKHFGFIAQELQKVLPELVSNNLFPAQYDQKHNKIQDEIKYLGVNYEEMIPVIVAAMQEQQKQIEDKNNQLDVVMKELADLKKQVASIQQSNSANNAAINNSTLAGNASLSQNVPNPANNTTTINYYLPAKTNNAAIALYDMQGRQLKYVAITGTGNGNIVINTKEFASGMFVYRLMINGTVADAKTMEIIK